MTKGDLLILLSDVDDNTEIYIDMNTDSQYENDTVWISDVREPQDYVISRRVQDMRMAQRACKKTSKAKKCIVL